MCASSAHCKKRGIFYSEAVSFVRTRLRFSILRTVLMAVRGFRGKEMREDDPNSDINLIETPYESQLCKVILCIVIMCILNRKHLSVPPGLRQRQESLFLAFSVFFSAAQSQVLPPFFLNYKTEDRKIMILSLSHRFNYTKVK